MITKAIEFATKKHSGQFRKITGLPYVTHPIEVARLVEQFKSSKNMTELKVAALLHDTLEDTNATFSEIAMEFSPLIASLVLELTSDSLEIKKTSKCEYLKRKMLGMSSYGLFIKLCDRLSNLRDNPTDKSKSDTKAILEFLKANRKLSLSQLSVIQEIELCY
jgi:(p)ppGpp synthase/HD superfamily hydrolase